MQRFTLVDDKHPLKHALPGYKFDKLIGFSCLLILVGLFGYVFISEGVGGFSISCPSNVIGGHCQNPFWKDCEMNAMYGCTPKEYLPEQYIYLREEEFFPAGFVAGNPPSFLNTYFGWVAFVLVIITILVNHFVHNKGYVFRGEGLGEWVSTNEFNK